MNLQNRNEDKISFPIGSSGILKFLSNLSFAEFMNQIKVKCSDGNNWKGVNFICLNDSLALEPNESVEFYFPNIQILLTAYKICTNFSNWKIYISNDGLNYSQIHSISNSMNTEIQIFEFDDISRFSYLKIVNDSDSDFNNSLIRLEIFGAILNSNQTFSFNKLIQKSIPQANSGSIYSFDEDCGLFAFFSSLLSKNAFGVFYLFSMESSRNSNILNLLTNDNSSWFSENKSNSKIGIYLRDNWMIHITSFKLKTGENFFIKSLKVTGKTSNWETITLVEFEEKNDLQYPFFEKKFPILANDYVCDIQIEQTGPNSNENHIFCLSQIEIYGELKNRE